MENNMQTNSEQNKQKSYVTSDTSFTPDKNTHETPMTDHSLNENEGSREQKQTQRRLLRAFECGQDPDGGDGRGPFFLPGGDPG